MSTHGIDLLPENDRTNGWAAHLPPRTPKAIRSAAGTIEYAVTATATVARTL